MVEVSIKPTENLMSAYVAGICCLTPKCTLSSRKSFLYTSQNLYSTFGDPYIDPEKYTDLILAKKLLDAGITVCLVSIEDGSNGSTEFDNTSTRGNDSLIKWELSSNIRFCIPVMTAKLINSKLLNVNVSLYYKSVNLDYTTRELSSSSLYASLDYSMYEESTDEDLVALMLKDGLTLSIDKNCNLLDALRDFCSKGVSYISFADYKRIQFAEAVYSDFNLNLNKYKHTLGASTEIESEGLNAYKQAFDKLHESSKFIDFVADGSLKESYRVSSNDDIISYSLREMNPSDIRSLHNYIQSLFNEDSHTYVLLNTPDLCVGSTELWLQSLGMYSKIEDLTYHFNNELFYGYLYSYETNSLLYTGKVSVKFTTSMLVLYNILLSSNDSNVLYTQGMLSEISVPYIKPYNSISESYANKLLTYQVNSLVYFDRNEAWVFGDSSLSKLSSLKEAHNARLLTHISKLISNYIDTVKFIINTDRNLKSVKNYIDYNILQAYLNSGWISEYNTSITTDPNSRNIIVTVSIVFYKHLEEIKISFTSNYI